MQDAAATVRPGAGGEVMLGAPVRCAGGLVVGRVRSLRADPGGCITHVVVSLGSFPRLGDDLRAVPLALMRAADGHYALSCSAEALRSAPILTCAARWGDARFCKRLADHFEAFV